MFRSVSLVVCLVFASAVLDAANNKEQGRLETCGTVMQEILAVPDNIPQELLEKAECVIVIPSMTKVAVGVGGSYGRGAMVCRTGKTFTGAWGSPAMYTLEGGSFGLQLGGESTDVVMLVMNQRGVDALLNSKVKLGADASASAGPKGREVERIDRRHHERRDSQLLAVARALRWRLARGHIAAARRRCECAGLRTQADGAIHRHRPGGADARVRPHARQCAAEELAAQRIEVNHPMSDPMTVSTSRPWLIQPRPLASRRSTSSGARREDHLADAAKDLGGRRRVEPPVVDEPVGRHPRA